MDNQFFITVEPKNISEEKLDERAALYARFENNELLLNISKEKRNEYNELYLTGYAEGTLTKQLIINHYQNLKKFLELNEKAEEYIDNEYNMLEEYVDSGKKPYIYVYAWLRGLSDSTEIPLTDLYFINLQSDFYYIEKEFNLNSTEMTEFIERSLGTIQLLNDDSLLISHSQSNFYYFTQTRITKTVIYNINQEVERISFPSYPGLFSSGDDFYIIHNDEEIGVQNRIVYTQEFPINISQFQVNTEWNPTSFELMLWLIGMVEMDDVMSVSEFQIVDINLDKNDISVTEVINSSKYYYNLTDTIKDEKFVITQNIPSTNESEFGINFSSDYFKKDNPIKMKFENEEKEIMNVDQLVNFVKYINETDPRICLGARFDLCKKINCSIDKTISMQPLDYGQIDYKVTNTELVKNFTYYFNFGVNDWNGENKFVFDNSMPDGIAETVHLTTSEGQKVVSCMDENILDCDSCTDEKYTMESFCTECSEEYVQFYNVEKKRFDCKQYNFTVPIALFSTLYFVIVVMLVIWISYFFRRPAVYAE